MSKPIIPIRFHKQRNIENSVKTVNQKGIYIMEYFMREHQIDTLFHFTRARNLPNIFKYGLMPKDTICKKGIDATFNDLYRYDNCESALCMSLEFPNYKMFYSLRMANNEEWAVIKLDANILLDFECVFCATNAGSEESYSKSLKERTGCNALKKLYEDYPGKPDRCEMGLKNWYPTNPQAEVLVFGCVPLRYIKGVYFNGETTLQKYKSYIPEEIDAKTDANYFCPREDWRFWQKGD